MMKPTLLIMAAGIGSRYGGLKQLDKIGYSGEAIMEYSIYDAIRAGFEKVVFVVRESFLDNFKSVFEAKLEERIKTDFITQEIYKVPSNIQIHPDRQKPWGTGHAILVAAKTITGPFAVINADDFYGYDAFVKMYDFLTNECNDKTYSLVGYKLSQTISDYGSVSRGVCQLDENGYLLDIHERTKIQKKDDKIVWVDDQNQQHLLSPDNLVSMNFWGFPNSLFEHLSIQFSTFLKKFGMELTSEFYIPTVVDNLLKHEMIRVKVLSTDAQWYGITYKEDKKAVIKGISSLIRKGEYPRNLWI